MKATLCHIKKNTQGTNSEGKEAGVQINKLEHKEEINSQPEQSEETRIQENEERLRNLWDNFKHSNIQITGVPEGEVEGQEIENLFAGRSDSPKEVGPKEAHTKAHHTYIT